MTTPLPNTGRLMIQSVAEVDASLRAALEEAARDAERILRRGTTGVGSQVSQAQLLRVISELRELSHDLWGNKIPSRIARVIALAEQRSSSVPDVLDRIMINRMKNPMLEQALRDANKQRAKRVAQVFKTRQSSARFELSPRVWSWQAWHNQSVERRIASGFAQGKSAREIAASVKEFINPNVRGGSSYAARRLGRTEVANAFHAQTIADYKGNPFVEGMKWHLSGSHPRADDCDQIAQDHTPGFPDGVYEVLDTPNKPHPQCLCYVAPETISNKQFSKRYARGDFNEYLLGKFPDIDPSGLPPF